MYRAAIGFIRGWQSVNSITCYVEQAAVDLLTYRHSDRLAGIPYFCAAHKTFGTVHRYCANAVFTQVLLYFQYQLVAVLTGQLQCVKDLRKLAATTKINVHNRADDLLDFTNVWHKYVLYLLVSR